MSPRKRIYALAAAVSLAVVPALAGQHDTVEVSGAFVREPIDRVPNTAAYLTIKNNGAAPDRLLSAATPAAEKAELHAHEIDAQGVARMRPVPAIDVPAGGVVELKPGGLHIMMMGVEAGLKAGAIVPLTLTFEKAGRVEVEAPVMPISATGAGGMGHGAMGRGTMEHGAMPEMPKKGAN